MVRPEGVEPPTYLFVALRLLISQSPARIRDARQAASSRSRHQESLLLTFEVACKHALLQERGVWCELPKVDQRLQAARILFVGVRDVVDGSLFEHPQPHRLVELRVEVFANVAGQLRLVGREIASPSTRVDVRP